MAFVKDLRRKGGLAALGVSLAATVLGVGILWAGWLYHPQVTQRTFPVADGSVDVFGPTVTARRFRGGGLKYERTVAAFSFRPTETPSGRSDILAPEIHVELRSPNRPANSPPGSMGGTLACGAEGPDCPQAALSKSGWAQGLSYLSQRDARAVPVRITPQARSYSAMIGRRCLLVDGRRADAGVVAWIEWDAPAAGSCDASPLTWVQRRVDGILGSQPRT